MPERLADRKEVALRVVQLAAVKVEFHVAFLHDFKIDLSVQFVLKPGGTIAILVNSVHDSEIPKGEKIEDDFYQIGDMKKRFFSAESIKKFASMFDIVLADENGETYKDRAIGNSHLVRLVAKKA